LGQSAARSDQGVSLLPWNLTTELRSRCWPFRSMQIWDGLALVRSGGLVMGVQVPEVRPCGSGAGWLCACNLFSGGRRVWLAPGFLSGGSLWWSRRCLGAFVWVLVGYLGCVGSRMVCVGGFHGVGVFVLLPRSWRRLRRSASVSPLRLCEVLWPGISWTVVSGGAVLM
jgi:hypothetical protein